jgi:hypothetical protein
VGPQELLPTGLGFFRRNHFVPVRAAHDLDELNTMLLAGCREDEARRIDDSKPHTSGDSTGRPPARYRTNGIERDHGSLNERLRPMLGPPSRSLQRRYSRVVMP